MLEISMILKERFRDQELGRFSFPFFLLSFNQLNYYFNHKDTLLP